VRVVEELRLEIGGEVVGQQGLQLVLEESLELVPVQVYVHCIADPVVHLEIRNHLERLHIDALADPDDFLGIVPPRGDRMVEVFRDLVLAKTKAILLGAEEKAIQHLHCLSLRPNIEIVVSKPHQKSILYLYVLILEAGEVKTAEHSRNIESLRNAQLLQPRQLSIVDYRARTDPPQPLYYGFFCNHALPSREDVDRWDRAFLSELHRVLPEGYC